MKIRSLLTALALAATLPIALLAAVTVERVWALQRDTQHARFQERVSAIRLALDTELGATIRMLRAMSESSDFSPGRPQPSYRVRFERVLANNPMWAGIALRRADGSLDMRLRNGVVEAEMLLDDDTLQRLQTTDQPVISDLVDVATQPRRMTTFVAVPLPTDSGVPGALYIGIRNEDWLGFLGNHPIASGATLTLSDRNQRVIARTLHHEQWAGRMSGPAFRKAVIGRDEGTFVAPGLEGKDLYVAFSRLRSAQWTLGTGVPRTDVEAALLGPTLLALSGVLLACLAAGGGAFVLARRIAGAMSALALTARTVSAQAGPPLQAPLAVEEAETVRLALHQSAERLAARQAELAEALRKEELAHAEAERGSRSKDELLAMLGHELRNPLSAMRSAVHVLGMSGVSADADRRAREIVGRQIGHLTKIVDDMLDVARMTSGKLVLRFRPVDLARVVANVVDSFSQAGRCGHLSMQTRYSPVMVLGDETRLEQIVANLLDNACKYTPAGGSLVVSVDADEAHATVSIQDTGMGIAADLLPHVFSVFEQGKRTLDRAQGGLGLGLAVVRRLVELHGGKVEAQSEGADRGALFRFTLDRLPAGTSIEVKDAAAQAETTDEGGTAAQEAAVAPTKSADANVTPPAPQAPPAPGGLRIVVIEDNDDSREAMVALLGLEGHRVSAAADGQAGLEALLQAEDADVALIDIGLPELDGMSLAQTFRAAVPPDRRRLTLIALTGYGSSDDRARALAAGFDHFMVKPFSLKTFSKLMAAETTDA